MLRTQPVLICLMVLILCPVSLGQTVENKDAKTDPNDLWSQYKLIVDRNIFSRQRGQRKRPEKRASESDRPRYVPTPESILVLKGVVKENQRFVAFIEDTSSSSILRIKAGMDVARGKVEALTLDHVVFSYDGKTRIITIGQNLEGVYGSGNIGLSEVLQWSENTSTSKKKESTPKAGSEAGSAEASDILKKLMERRRQQLGD